METIEIPCAVCSVLLMLMVQQHVKKFRPHLVCGQQHMALLKRFLSPPGRIYGSPLGEGQRHVKNIRLHLLHDKHKQDGRIGIGGISGFSHGEFE